MTLKINEPKAKESTMAKAVQWIGAPLDRADGELKTTGKARYAADFPLERMVYGVPIVSPAASGSLIKLEVEAAEKLPGVLFILTHENAKKIFPIQNDFGTATKLAEGRFPLQDKKIYYAGQYVGLAAAETLEIAQEAARLIKVICKEERSALDSEEELPYSYFPDNNWGTPLPVIRGNFEKAFSNTEVQLKAVYTTPVEHHNPMEPHACTAVWDGDNLILYESTQWVVGARNVVADALGLPREKVRIISHFVGGGFGCKGFVWPHTLLAAMTAMHLKRPVKVVLSRSQMAAGVGHRPATHQELSIGSSKQGKLTAIKHHTITQTSFLDDFLEAAGGPTQSIYSCPNLLVSYQVVRLNHGTPTFMRAPGECTGLFALESLLDELSYTLNLDPIELRLNNLSDKSPEEELPWSNSHIKECYELGSKIFGWKERNPKPKTMKRKGFLVGLGMATAMFPGVRSPGAAKVKILSDGTAEVLSATQDLGTGTYTTMKQIAAEVLRISPHRIVSKLGDSSYPPAPVSGGSMTSASVGPAVKSAAEKAIEALIHISIKDSSSCLYHLPLEKIHAADGKLVYQDDPSKTEIFEEILKRNNLSHIEGESFVKPDNSAEGYTVQSHGAQFAEVEVHPLLGQIRVTRMVGVFDVGRILNQKTARSQAIGGMIMGIGMALHEKTVYDPRTGRVVTDNLCDYLIPVMADSPAVEADFIDKPDPRFNSLGVRGLGEIGITGVAAATANAVYHATGIRIRDLPITPDKLLKWL